MSLIEASTITGLNLYFLVRNISGQVWNGISFENYNLVNWNMYVNMMTEQVPSGYYYGTFPSIASPGKYSVTAHSQVDVDPLATDEMIASGEILWNGVDEDVQLTTDQIDELAQAVLPINPTRDQAKMAIFMSLRNKITVTDNLKAFHDSGDNVVFKKPLSDDGVTYTEQAVVAGP
jgi:hypothetical protein